MTTAPPAFFDECKRIRRDGLDLGNHEVRLFQLDDGKQCFRIGHVDGMSTMSHLVPRGIGIPIHRNHFDAQTLQRDDNFLTQLA